MLDLGTVVPGTTVYIPFHTFDSNDPSASVTLTGLATTDIEVYKNGSTTQRASVSGYTLLDTDGIDFDTTTGIHGISIDLSDNTTAGFYAAGAQYWVVIASVTVDAATINFIAATFRIGYPGALLNTTIAAYTSTDNFTLNAGSADDNAYNGCILVAHDVASAVQTQIGVIEDYTGSTKTVNLKADPGVFTMTANDNISILPPSLLPVTMGTTVSVDTNGRLDIIKVAGTTQTALDINDILTDTGTTLDTKLNDIQGATFSSATDSLEAIRDRGDAAWTGSVVTSDTGTAQAGSTSTITLRNGAPSGFADQLKGHTVYITGGTGIYQTRSIASYDVTTPTAPVATMINDWDTAPSTDSTYDVYPVVEVTEVTAAPTAAVVAAAVWDENTSGHTAGGTFGEQLKNDVDAILTDTNALQTDWVDGGRLDLILDAILDDTAEIGAAGAGLTAVPWNASWDAEVQSECNDALVALGLDHLVSAAVVGADVTDNSIVAKLVDDAATADWDNYDNQTASLEALNVDTDAILALETKIDTIDTVVDAIKVVTDKFVFTVANQVDSNIQSVNDVTITGDGSATPFNV